MSVEVRARDAARTFDHLIVALLYAQLDSLGLFSSDALRGEESLRRWRQRTGLIPLYERWLVESLRILCQHGFLERTTAGFELLSNPAVQREDPWGEWDRTRQAWLEDPAASPHVGLLDATLRALPRILTGASRATDVLFQDASLERVGAVHAGNPVADHFNVVLTDTLTRYIGERLRHDPAARLRILEIGAGTGGTSVKALEALEPHSAAIEEYRYTDVSASFLQHAEERFKARYPFLTFGLFNVEHPPERAELRPGSFDVVIAANVLHATRNIRKTLRNTKATLKRHGWLLLNEVCASSLPVHLTFGLLEGWWLFEDDALRIQGAPVLSPANWRHVLLAEGFQQICFPAADAEALGQQVIVAASDGVIRNFRSIRRKPPAVSTASQPPSPSPAAASSAVTHISEQGLIEHVREAIRGSLASAVRIDERRIED